MASRQGLIRGLVAACLLGTAASPVIGLITALPAGQGAPQTAKAPQDRSMVDFAAAKAGWVDEFEYFAARHSPAASDAQDPNVVVVAKAVPGLDAAAGTMPESIEPKDAPKIPAAAAKPVDDDALLKTGSIKSQHLPLLPPVPGPEAFKVQKGDRLGPQRIDPSHTAPSGVEGTPDAGIAAPHAELMPARAGAPVLPLGKSAMLLPARGDKLKPVVAASLSMKPMDLAPVHPDVFFQGPPMPADPTIDPDAPVLGYAEQMASAEAPFKSLFAVTPVAKHSWLGTDPSSAKAKATKPSRQARLPHRHGRKRDG